MAAYRFHGQYAEIHVGAGINQRGYVLKTYGQVIDLDDKTLKEVVDQGCRLLPEGEFVEVFPETKINTQAPDFGAKHEAVEAMYQNWKENLLRK